MVQGTWRQVQSADFDVGQSQVVVRRSEVRGQLCRVHEVAEGAGEVIAEAFDADVVGADGSAVDADLVMTSFGVEIQSVFGPGGSEEYFVRIRRAGYAAVVVGIPKGGRFRPPAQRSGLGDYSTGRRQILPFGSWTACVRCDVW